MDGKVINILLVEDDKLDAMNVQRVLDKMQILHKTSVARNGEEALSFLAEHAQRERPDVLLLDINMPKMNGIEFLTELRRTDEWKDIKVFVVTTSDERVDRQATERLGISGYIVKPLRLNNPASMDSFNLMIDLMNMRSR